jgi:hypothetical protein
VLAQSGLEEPRRIAGDMDAMSLLWAYLSDPDPARWASVALTHAVRAAVRDRGPAAIALPASVDDAVAALAEGYMDASRPDGRGPCLVGWHHTAFARRLDVFAFEPGTLTFQRAVLLLDTDDDARRADHYRASWRAFWHAVTLGQFCPELTLRTTTGDEAYTVHTSVAPDPVDAALSDDDRLLWDLAIEDAEPSLVGTLEQLRDRGWPPPESLDLSTGVSVGRTLPLCWPSAQLTIDDGPIPAGWTGVRIEDAASLLDHTPP